ncbi:hypothetical protein [Coraliomargarita sinensis]|uniref:hypothetical protein n=1 Tax=Coraliomargarita sinensis TaxID=2174842 RepID=UPI0011B3FCA7|nr:hypothetical protein [Coraliomargarita sinensis]
MSDYTQRLAQTLHGMGCECLCVSLNEKQGEQVADRNGVRIVRYKREAARDAIAYLREWNPDWISLQFVSFAFHEKGLFRYLIPLFRELGRRYKIHIMFHELWVRPGKGAPAKHVLLGWLQKRLILAALRTWQPNIVQTSNPLYRFMLGDAGIQADELPLFGNIPIVNTDAPLIEPERSESLRRILLPFSQSKNWNIRATMEILKQCADNAGVTLEIIQVGLDRDGERHWKFIKEFCRSAGWQFRQLGPLKADDLSRCMLTAHLGMNSIHKEMAGRSGAVVSMREHGLTVICAGPPASEKEYQFNDLDNGTLSLFEDTAACVAELKKPSKKPPEPKLPQVAEQFVRSLENHT